VISSVRLAWLQLRRQKVRLLVALAGVAFAVILMMMQIGFEDALYRSGVNFHRLLKADIVMLNPHYSILPRLTAFPRRRLYQALGFKGVASVAPIYTSLSHWQNPATGRLLDVFTIGIDPARETLDVRELRTGSALLRYPDVVLFDALSRPEYGPVPALLRTAGEVGTEASNHRIAVRGLVRVGTSFGIDGTIITSDVTFFRILPGLSRGAVGIGLVQLEPGADANAVRDALAAAFSSGDVDVLTKQQYIDRETAYWATATPIGYVFTFGVVMGLVVGAIIVYQILFADIADHLGEYATLKAIGYRNGYLAGVVLMEAVILGVGGFFPALGLCAWLYGVTAAATNLPLQVTTERTVLVLALTIAMCCVSGLISLRKLRSADPAEIF